MTSQVKARQPLGSAHGGHDGLLSALWAQQADTFPRLPDRAPLAIVEDTIEIKDPERVYRIYRASRRHQFQLLVEAFILQIRYGCCASSSTAGATSCHCSTPTCFTYRRRVAGSKPIRRFTATSARTLAVTLASNDNPESALCPHLSSDRTPATNKHSTKQLKPAQDKLTGQGKVEALNDLLIKSGREPLSTPQTANTSQEKRESSVEDTTLSTSDGGKTKRQIARSSSSSHRHAAAHQVDIWAEEQGRVKLDPRSFVQNVFNTDAMRMLEWLTPSSIDGLTSRIKQALYVSNPNEAGLSGQKPAQVNMEETNAAAAEAPSTTLSGTAKTPADPAAGELKAEEAQKSTIPAITKHRRRSDIRATSPPGLKPYTSSVLPDLRRRDSSDMDKPSKLARTNSLTDDSNPQRRRSSEKRTKMSMSPSIKSASLFGHEVLLPTVGEIPVALPKVTVITPPEPMKKKDSLRRREKITPSKPVSEPAKADIKKSRPERLPQSLGVLSETSVQMLSTILLADAPADLYADRLGTLYISKTYMSWARNEEINKTLSSRLPGSAPAWRAFAEQSFFYVLSDSKALLASFTDDSGRLMSNIDIEHMFLRIGRVAPDVMLDALWIAAGDLYQMPADLAKMQDSTKPITFKADSTKVPLNRGEAGQLIAILFSALTATLPSTFKDIITERTFRERQDGHSYQHTRVTDFALELDDALSNDLALRLARRLFAALPVRESFMLLTRRNGLTADIMVDGAAGLLRALRNETNLEGGSDAAKVLGARLDNEQTRTLCMGLRAWATKIFMEDWDGSAIVPKDGAIGGALSVLQALSRYHDWTQEHQPLDSLVMEFISDRLDASDIPVDWLSWSPKGRQEHLLDYPFLFPADTLVTYFRAINFSRMSAAHDSAVGTQHRVQALAQPSTLVTGAPRMQYLYDKLRIAMSRFMVLNIRRTAPLEDAFDQLWRREERELLRPLKVKLGEDGGELGSDSGGVQAEFFRLAFAEALNPDYGCFTVDERTKMAWFMPSSPEPLWKFQLLGLLFGLAIYNGITLPVTFPYAFYAKILGKKVETVMDIQDGWPSLASGLQTLLDWDEHNGAIEDVFCRTYEFSIDAFGRQISRNMTPMANRTEVVWPQFRAFDFWDNHVPMTKHCENAPMVTGANREEYVADYIQFLTTFSVGPQLDAFKAGLRRVVDAKSLRLLTPEIFQEVVEGVQHVSVSGLEEAVRYEGYTSQSPTIRDFWAVVRGYNQEMRKKLLEFVTASDRVPVGGMAGMTFVIQRNGQAEEGVGYGDRERDERRDSSASDVAHWEGEEAERTPTGAELRASAFDRAQRHRTGSQGEEERQERRPKGRKAARLPTAYTCYGTLLLPEYRDRETLREKLGMALENAKGFGFA